jgi:hypothetical protein
MTGDIHFSSGYPVFGLVDRMDMGSHFWLKMVVEHIPPKMLDGGNHFRFSGLPSPLKVLRSLTCPNVALSFTLNQINST